jgi:hypothetical protein
MNASGHVTRFFILTKDTTPYPGSILSSCRIITTTSVANRIKRDQTHVTHRLFAFF